ncbi:type II toxin-antitoxin system RelE/ParE family toxin [Sphingomonas sp. BK235]|uniref:type II toxin-antitoxin system RelE/ParE family toxin n=1 Tax=Sphingomonas sp. BK235 TaxID=2512131 RepID=UPI001045C461|nr:type II toxin-antitoxin system RelE/ParE family toxin [Sphingomonas sp. BK235]TCP30718.1 proteic killer suppression protein [Sphingomonas sp. BK235]
MLIESIRHKALRRFAETGKAKGLPSEVISRIGLMLLFLDQAVSTDALLAPPNYGAHQLSGDRAGTWALTVTRNWRMTFSLDEEGAIVDLDLEDYH